MDKIKWGGYLGMKKLVVVKFEYEDGSYDEIVDPRACLAFQSRANSNGLLSGLEDYVVHTEIETDDAQLA